MNGSYAEGQKHLQRMIWYFTPMVLILSVQSYESPPKVGYHFLQFFFFFGKEKWASPNNLEGKTNHNKMRSEHIRKVRMDWQGTPVHLISKKVETLDTIPKEKKLFTDLTSLWEWDF